MQGRVAVLLTATVLIGAGCNSILGIREHELANAAAGASGRPGSSAGGESGEGGLSDAAGGGGGTSNTGHGGSSAGVEAAGAGGEGGAPQSCVEGDVECSSVNPTVPQTCDSSGHWVDGRACQHVCADGSCIGVCTPGTTQCRDVTPQTCDDTGTWVDGSVMMDTCKAVCTPGDHECQVNDRMTCQDNGTWQVASSCLNGCLNGQCRDNTYGTIGLAGSVTCETSPGLLTCATNVTTTTPCCWNYAAMTGSCYATTCPGYDGTITENFSVACDGPNDCSAGQVCCFVWGMAAAQTSCTSTCVQPAPPYPIQVQIVCDPGAPACASGTCQPITRGTPLGTALYTCQ